MDDEIKFQENCSRQSFYISLEDQDTITKEGTPQLSRQILSKDHVTYIYFALHHEQHWAAVQISISPFSIQSFPGQKFYSCHFRYTLCCPASSETGPSIDLIITVVQRIYDARFRPVDWDFSVKDCRTYDPLKLAYSLDEISCAKRAEHVLLDYIHAANNLSDADNGVIGGLGYSGADDGVQPASPSAASSAPDCPSQLRTKRRRTHDSGAGPGNQSNDYSRTNEEEEEKVATNLAKKILGGVKRIKKQASSEFQRQTGSTAGAVVKFDARSANGDYKDRSLYLEHLLWRQSHIVMTDARATAWRYRFLVACLCCLRHTDINVLQKEDQKLWRWIRASRMINSIVEGLWEAWGSKAVLVYEALAEKFYLLSNTSGFAEKRQQAIISGTVTKLSNEPPPDVPPDTPVLHPAAWISKTMTLDYQKVCIDLGLVSFARLGPLYNSEIQVSMSSLCLGNGPDGEPDVSNTPQCNILTAVAVTQTSSTSSEAAPVENTPNLVSRNQLHDSMAYPGPVSLPAVFAGDSTMDDADREQLTRKDLLLHASHPTLINVGDSWDIPEWSNFGLPPLFNTGGHFDVFGNFQESNERFSSSI